RIRSARSALRLPDERREARASLPRLRLRGAGDRLRRARWRRSDRGRRPPRERAGDLALSLRRVPAGLRGAVAMILPLALLLAAPPGELDRAVNADQASHLPAAARAALAKDGA